MIDVVILVLKGFVRSLGFLDEEANIRVVVLEPGVIKARDYSSYEMLVFG